MGDVLNTLHPTLGRFVFPFVFCWGLIYILFLNGELITSNMMYLTAGLYRQWIAPRKALKMVILCTVGNIVGAYFVAWLASYTSALQGYDAMGMAATMVEGKLAKSGMEIIFAGTLANLLVNIAILSWLLIENQASRMATVMSAIVMFVYLGFEHVVANFGSFALLHRHDRGIYLRQYFATVGTGLPRKLYRRRTADRTRLRLAQSRRG